MKKLITLLLLVTGLVAYAQQNPPLPVDPKVRTGKLENGLTYYIRQNNLPENRADFYIAQKVGSMQEEDNQAGLLTSWSIWHLTGRPISPEKVC
jgi:zinc protease